jgi:hypothetical protein
MNVLDDLDGLDGVLGPLRGAATPTELANESSTVERMVAAHRSASTGRFAATPRRAKVAALVAAGVLGFGGMAAASPSMLGTREPLPVVTEIDEPPADDPRIGEAPADGPVDGPPVDEPSADEVPGIDPPVIAQPVIEVPVEMPEIDVPVKVPVAERSPSVDESTCLPGHHGATVGAIARGELSDGVSVTDAARSLCGPPTQPGADEAPAASAGPPTPRHEQTPRFDRGASTRDHTSKDHPGTREDDRGAPKHEAPGKPADTPSVGRGR